MGKWDIHTYPVKSIKRVRIVRRADGFYVQFCVDVECKENVPSTGQEIGLDFGLEHFYTDSNGHHEPNPRFLRNSYLAPGNMNVNSTTTCKRNHMCKMK
jgi:putative transposase